MSFNSINAIGIKQPQNNKAQVDFSMGAAVEQLQLARIKWLNVNAVHLRIIMRTKRTYHWNELMVEKEWSLYGIVFFFFCREDQVD